jgi:tryptophan-rich sensory protein
MWRLVLSILICQSAGIIGSIFTRRSITEWYVHINKPAFNPPNWVFAPVWTVLYTMMGIAAFFIWRKGLNSAGVKSALFVFLVQLILNSVWSMVFFGGRSILGGLIVIALLWLAIIMSIKSFYAISKPAAALLLPYLAWVSFALVLNVALLLLL